VAEGIGTRCIGENPSWQQDIGMGRRGTQIGMNVPMPFDRDADLQG